MTCISPYLPLGELKLVAPEVWIIDGPEIRMQYLGLHVPFPTRATVIRLRDGTLWIHSPVTLDDDLAGSLERLGEPRCLVAPNTLHYSWIAAWKARWPTARVYIAPGLESRFRESGGAFEILTETPPESWESEFSQTVVLGPLLTEVEFFHAPSRTLILTDLIENFELDRVCGRWRWVLQACGCADPDGKAPIDMQLSFLGRRRELRAAVERMIAWNPERVLLAHGRPYIGDGVAELRRAFRWVLR